ncbi:MAG: hypothetical protein QME41_03840 [Actinomycetota bacterium]|nr:hypothetical protein [Actinomycetota bacterium]
MILVREPKKLGEVLKIRELIFETSSSILLVHHHRKSGGEHGDEMRGSSAILGAVDVALNLHRETEQATATLKVTSRFASVEDEVIKLDADTLFWNALGSSNEYKKTKRENDILKALEDEGECDNQTLSEILDLDPRNFRGELKQLVTRGWISERKQSTSGRPRYLYSLAAEYFSAEGIKGIVEKFNPSEQVEQSKNTFSAKNQNPGVEKNAEKSVTCDVCGKPTTTRHNVGGTWACGDCRQAAYSNVPF